MIRDLTAVLHVLRIKNKKKTAQFRTRKFAFCLLKLVLPSFTHNVHFTFYCWIDPVFPGFVDIPLKKLSTKSTLTCVAAVCYSCFIFIEENTLLILLTSFQLVSYFQDHKIFYPFLSLQWFGTSSWFLQVSLLCTQRKYVVV